MPAFMVARAVVPDLADFSHILCDFDFVMLLTSLLKSIPPFTLDKKLPSLSLYLLFFWTP
jgi:hypothetical protein